MALQIKEEGDFRFAEQGEGPALVLLHGLFGQLSNWGGVIDFFARKMRVITPMLPIYDMPIKDTGLGALREFLERFVAFKRLNEMTVMGNSLGGHIALLYALKNPDKVSRLVLTGSSGLFESGMGGSYPRRGNYDYIKERVGYTFYDPNVASEELVQEVFEITKSIPKCMRIVAIAKSAQRNNLADLLPEIAAPTLLVWGLNDSITPTAVGHEFNSLIPNSELRFIDKCCHAPMMEHPEKFNEIVDNFVSR